MADANYPKNETVGLFLRAMVDREPGKRKVKPSKAALIDLAELDLGESSDDSDFNVDEAKLKEDDDISINSDPDDDDDDEEDDDDDEEDIEEEKEVQEKTQNRSKEKGNLTIGELIAQAQEKQTIAAEQGITRPKFLVCAICLGEHSDDANEIVTCDGCHVSVHEGCYGISDTISVSSTVSSSSTEPWFCDACKAGVENPPCELCPNLGYSIFKETEMGRWVHLVCALYIPGIAFSEVDKLSFPTLFEMPYSKYGAKTCSFCEDERFCKTGVCIGCDAGMCRSYFHVTCAQREGLLSEVNHGEADQADPYYAHCKLHTDRDLMRRRKRNWLALQLHMRQGEKEKLSESQETQDRLQRKLSKYREKYLFTKANRPTPWFPTQKMPRSLSTSASFFRSLLHKTQLMGVETETPVMEPHSMGDIRKKWHIPPAFNVEFISYYLDRTSRLQEMKSRLTFLLQENDDLTKEESELRSRYNTLSVEADAIETENAALLNKSLEIHDWLKGLAGRPLRLPPVVAALHNPPYVEVGSTAVDGQTGSVGGGKEKRLITKAAAKMMSGNLPSMPAGVESDGCGMRSSGEKGFGAASAGVMSIHTCSVCQSTKEQHMLIQCDTCSHYYHLSCLDPPLSRMPKKTKQMGWQCSDCCKSSDSDKAPEIDTAAPRRLRRVIKEPTKFSPSVKDQKTPQDRPPDTETKVDPTSSSTAPAKGKTSPSKTTPAQGGGTKRRLSADGGRGKQKVRRRSLDTLRKGNKPPKDPKQEGNKNPKKGKLSPPDEGVQTPKTETSVFKKDSSAIKGETPTVKGDEHSAPKVEAPPKVETPPLKIKESPPHKIKTKVETTPLKNAVKCKGSPKASKGLSGVTDSQKEEGSSPQRTSRKRKRTLEEVVKDPLAKEAPPKDQKSTGLETSAKECLQTTSDIGNNVHPSCAPGESTETKVSPQESKVAPKETAPKEMKSLAKETTTLKEIKSLPKETKTPTKEKKPLLKERKSPPKEIKPAPKDIKSPLREMKSPLRDIKSPLRDMKSPLREIRSTPREVKSTPKETKLLRERKALTKETKCASKERKNPEDIEPLRKESEPLKETKSETKFSIEETKISANLTKSDIIVKKDCSPETKSFENVRDGKVSESNSNDCVMKEVKALETKPNESTLREVKTHETKPNESVLKDVKASGKETIKDLKLKEIKDDLENNSSSFDAKVFSVNLKTSSGTKNILQETKTTLDMNAAPSFKESTDNMHHNKTHSAESKSLSLDSKTNPDVFKPHSSELKPNTDQTKAGSAEIKANSSHIKADSHESKTCNEKVKCNWSEPKVGADIEASAVGAKRVPHLEPKISCIPFENLAASTVISSGVSCSSPPMVTGGMNSSSVPSSSSSSSSCSASCPPVGGASLLDVSADSLPSPHSESFPSEEDPSGGPSRKERRHRDREGGKKKKKDRDKEEGGRKRKKHHRERHSLGEMASEMVSPFRIKIKPLPPRPNGMENLSPSNSAYTRNQGSEGIAAHTTTTTTAPPGYPPLPPGYTLTHPMIIGTKVHPNPPSSSQATENTNGSSSRTQTTASTSSTTTTSSTTCTPTTASTSTTSPATSTATTSSSSTAVCAPVVVVTGGRTSVGRRKSDPAAEQFSKCDVCGETGGVTNTVMCDECLKAYHFNCLEPPLKKSPKRRGYSWFCEDCDNASEKK